MKKYTFILLPALLFVSCQSLEQFTIDYKNPADVNFPIELKRIAVVNNMNEVPQDQTQLLLKKDSTNKKDERTTFYIGNPDIATESLAQHIAAENYFEEVIICDSALRTHDIFPRETTLGKEEVNQLCEELQADALISLESLHIKSVHTVNIVRLSVEGRYTFLGTLDVKVYPSIKIYIPQRNGPMVTINAQDSIFWEKYGNSRPAVMEVITPEQLLEEASEFAGSAPVKHLIPYWKTTERYIFTNGSVEMRDAKIYVQKNDWDKAFQLWMQAHNQTKKRQLQMSSALNIAVYHEMKDNPDEALTWATKALELNRNNPRYAPLITLYVKKLQIRQADQNKLNIQMQRFKEEF